MANILPRNRNSRVAVVLGLLVVIFVGGCAGLWYVARPMYKNWRERRANEVGREAFEKGDYTNALLAVRKTLGYNQNNVDAWKLAVEITEKQDTPEVVFYQQRLAISQPTFENRLKYLRLAVKYHYLGDAEKSLKSFGAEGGKSPEYLELAAKVSMMTGNATKAKYYLLDLIRLQPDNNKAKLDLAELRLVDGVAENKPSIRAEIRNLASEPPLRVRALSLLLTDALQTQNSTDALELSDQLVDLPNLQSASTILVLEAYRKYAPSHYTTLLEKTEKEWSSAVEKIVLLGNFLNTEGQSAEARRYIESLDDKTRKVEFVQVCYAYSLLLEKDFPALETFLTGTKWQEQEFVRYTLLAYRYRAAGRDRDFAEAWRLALIEVGNNLEKLLKLARQTNSWGWLDQKMEVLDKVFMMDPTKASVRAQLIAYYRGRGDTQALNRIFARIIELDPNGQDPNSKDYRNNFAYTSLLLKINTDRANQIAEANYRTSPQNTYYATTEALALYQQGKYADALKIMDSIGVSAVTVPERALLNGVLLVANHKDEEGSNLLMTVRPKNFLPEERQLLATGIVMLQKSATDRGNAAKLAELTARNSGGATRKSWLRGLPQDMLASPSVQMELADSAYSLDDYAGLENAVKSDNWENREFIRMALLSYADRGLNRTESESNSNWRAAVANAGNNSVRLGVLANLAHEWGWTSEYIEILSKTFQRDPSDDKSYAALTDYYSKLNQTSDLARIYRQRLESNPGDADAKARFSYYSLLTNINVARAYTLAKEAYDAAPQDEFRAKVYAFALYKQSRTSDGWQLLDKLGDQKEEGPLQLSLVKAALAAQQNQFKEARSLLGSFDAKSALPEETALANAIAKSLATQQDS